MNNSLYNILSNTDDNEFSYYITVENTVVISKYLGTSSDVIIPEIIENLPVTKVDAEAFMDNNILISISMPSVKIISTKAFYNCTSLINISAPILTHLIDNVFENCSALVTLDLPNLIYIRYDCFANCTFLENVNLPKVVYIPDRTFSYCTNLKNVNAPKIQDIGPCAFQYCLSLEGLNISNMSNINVPLLGYIDNLAFNNSSIKSVNLPLIVGLGNEAFYHCTALKDLILTKDLNVLGYNIFDSCLIENLTIDYGTENLCDVTIDNWNEFASKLTGINGVEIPGKYVKNDIYTKNLVAPDNLLCCTQIVAAVNAPVTMQWAIELLDGKIVFLSNKYLKWETMHLSLANLDLPFGTRFKLKAIIDLKVDHYSEEIFEYTPECYTLYYEYLKDGPSYRGKIDSPLSPPILKCSSLSVHHDAKAMTKYEIRLYYSNRTIYTSGRNTNGDTWWKNLGDIGLRKGTLVKLHAGVIGGQDSEPYVIIEYDPMVPSTEATAHFSFVGNSFYTAMLFQGTNPHLTSTDSQIKCDRVVGYLSCSVTIYWNIFLIDSAVSIYKSSKCLQEETCVIDLNTLNLEPGAQVYVEADYGSNHHVAEEILIYTPDSNATVYYQVHNNMVELLSYRGVVPLLYASDAEPYLRCTELSLKNGSTTLTKFGFYTLDGQELFKSGSYSVGKTCKVNFASKNIPAGTVFKVKALVIAGKDSTADITVQYDPESAYGGKVELSGVTTKNTLMYQGEYEV